MSALPKVDTSVPPPGVAGQLDFYQTWALQWSYYQQAQQAAYQNQIYQSFTNQQKPSSTPVPPATNVSNNFNSQQQQPNNNHNTNTTPSKWQTQSKR